MASKLSALIAATTEKTAPADADKMPLLDSVTSNYFRWISWGSLKAALSGLFVKSDPTGIAGAAKITNIVSLTQAQYDALGSKSATTIYLTVG